MAGSTSVMQPPSPLSNSFSQHQTDTHDHSSTSDSDPEEPEKTTIYDLPPEILDLFLENVPPSELQRTALSIQQVFPELAVSDSHIFRHVRVTSPSQLKPLWQRLREDKYEGEGRLIRAVRSFTMATFRGDADIMNNILRLIPDIEAMIINMGTNFAPEHLVEAFENPRPKIQRIELRFRPYVDKASYYQFLKGSYFDTAIETMIRTWPPTPTFTRLSIVQDIPPRFSVPHLAKSLMNRLKLDDAKDSTGISSTVTTDVSGNPSTVASTITSADASEDELVEEELEDTTPVEPRGYTGHGPFPFLSDKLDGAKPRTFAQPLVFHDIRCIQRLAVSDAAKHISHLRLRAPGKDIAKVLSETGDGKLARMHFPQLRFLDLSTTNLRHDGWFGMLVKRYDKLEHLVLDRTNIFGFQGKDAGAELCAELGKGIVMAGLARSKEREREIASWDLLQRRRAAERERARMREMTSRPAATIREDEEGGSGSDEDEDEAPVAQATPSTSPVYMAPLVINPNRRRNVRSAAHSTFSIRETSRRNRGTGGPAENDDDLVIAPPNTLALVLPPLPTLKTLNLGGEGGNNMSPQRAAEWDRKLHLGWKDGLDKVYDWAQRVGEKYERAVKAARQWEAQESGEAGSSRAGSSRGKQGSGSKKPPVASSSTNKAKTKPPLDIRLYRYPTAEESKQNIVFPDDDPVTGLIPVNPTEEDWRLAYTSAIADTESWCAAIDAGETLDELYRREGKNTILLCTVPDCEGPMRKSEDGKREDGRSGMSLVNGKIMLKGHMQHRQGCGHLVQRHTFGGDAL